MTTDALTPQEKSGQAQRRAPRPLRGPVFHILLALGNEELHGYKIMQRFEDETGEVLLPGTLYSSISRMLRDGLIEEVPSRSSEGDDARRRYYRVTEEGREVAAVEADRMRRLVELARRQSLLPDPSS